MKVLLKQDVDNLGYAGEVRKVADGYGRNYLIPQGLAVKATPNVMKQAEVWRKKAEARRAQQRAEYEALSEKIQEMTLTFTAKAGDTGKLYGSITTTQIADALNETLGTEIDRRKVGIEPLRSLGKHQVVVRLSAEFQPEVTVRIEAEDGRDIDEIEEEGEVEEAEEAAGTEEMDLEAEETAVFEAIVESEETEAIIEDEVE